MIDIRHAALLTIALGCAGCGGTEEASSDSKQPTSQVPQNAVGGFSAKIPEIVLQPGDEKQPCWVIPLELEGDSRWVAAGMLNTQRGLHHGNITSRPKTGEGVRRCGKEESGLAGGEAGDVLAGGQVLFGSTTQVEGEEWRHFTEGMAYQIPEGHEIVARMHYLNTTSKPLTVSPEYTWYTIPEEDVTREIAPYIWVYSNFKIPPKSETTVKTDCFLPQGMKIVEAMPHMHALATRFQGTYLGGKKDGEAWLDGPGYDPENGLIKSFDPPVELGQGDGVSFSCTWRNTFDKTIVEGVGDNEMCMMFGYAYPPKHSYTIYASNENNCLYIAP